MEDIILNSSLHHYEHCYRTSNLARKVVDLLPDKMASVWGEAVSVEPNNRRNLNIIQTITPQLEKLRDIYCIGQKTANLYGGCTSLRLVDDDNDWIDEINLKDVNFVKCSRIFEYWEISPYFPPREIIATISRDYHNPNYYYYLLSSSTERYVHKSRIIRFRGAFLPNTLLQRNNYWEDSYLTAFLPKLEQYDKAIENVAETLDSYSIPVIKKKGLINQFGKNLIEVIDGLKSEASKLMGNLSVKKGLLIDGDNVDVSFQQRSLSGINTIIETLLNDLVANSYLTRVQLLNEHPKGLQATGKSEKETESEKIKTMMDTLWGDSIRYDLKLLLAQYKIYDDRIKWQWNNAHQPTPLEEIEVKLKELELEEKQESFNSSTGNDVETVN